MVKKIKESKFNISKYPYSENGLNAKQAFDNIWKFLEDEYDIYGLTMNDRDAYDYCIEAISNISHIINYWTGVD